MAALVQLPRRRARRSISLCLGTSGHFAHGSQLRTPVRVSFGRQRGQLDQSRRASPAGGVGSWMVFLYYLTNFVIQPVTLGVVCRGHFRIVRPFQLTYLVGVLICCAWPNRWVWASRTPRRLAWIHHAHDDAIGSALGTRDERNRIQRTLGTEPKRWACGSRKPCVAGKCPSDPGLHHCDVLACGFPSTRNAVEVTDNNPESVGSCK
jgi:hypothetical protein